MILVNFSHPVTEQQRARIEALAGRAVERVIEAPAKIDLAQPAAPQVAALIARVGLSPEEWQTAPLLVNPPALAPIACLALAQMHGLMGHFPAIVRVSPRPGAVPPVFDAAELINLDAIRQTARDTR